MRVAALLVSVGLACLGSLGVSAFAAGDAAAAPRGKSYEYDYDGKADGHPERAWFGRAFVPPKTAQAEDAVPLVIFLHGLNKALIKYRWMGGGSEGDVRDMVGALVKKDAVTPVVVAGPSSIVKSQVSHGASWNNFDLDGFIDRTIARLDGVVEIDEDRIIVAGHSGAGCSEHGGLATATASRRHLLAILAIDTCMSTALAERWAATDPETNVIVSYQTIAWTNRPFDQFKKLWEKGVSEHPAAEGILRALDHQKPDSAPHDATVKLTLDTWLPKLLAPPPKEEQGE